MDYYSNKGGPWANYGAHNGHGGAATAREPNSRCFRESVLPAVRKRRPEVGSLALTRGFRFGMNEP